MSATPSPASFQSVSHCRVCCSTRVLPTGVTKKFHLSNLDQTVELGYAVCQDCQFLFQSEYVGDDFLNEYYRRSPMLRRKEPTRFERDQNIRQSAFLSRQVPLTGRKVLEIGAHAGAFLVHLHQAHGAQAYYDELSEEARTVLAAQPGLQDLRAQPKGFTVDVIVLRHILEHIFDLDGFLGYVRRLLSPGGQVFIETPDWSHLDVRTDPLIFEHLNQFSTHNLVLLLRRTGWNCTGLEKSIEADDPATPNRVQRLIVEPTALPAPGDPAIAGSVGDFLGDYRRRLFGRLEALIAGWGPQRRIAFYPASHLSFSALLEADLRQANLIGLYDIDPKKHGRAVQGVTIHPAEALREHQPDVIVIFTMAYEREIRESFARMGLTAEIISATALVRTEAS
ncbi:methyltransferase domain-containing protein [Oleiharenicola lentus]|uniref:Methyltransferase domain-containing protein n=2 Tax=Oleiharenicola lentus TaxID=2508720 RepID=A0A4V1M5X2_9BACT|nr:methyltransferase domain-containing protein [Oleiharenicola lentus]